MMLVIMITVGVLYTIAKFATGTQGHGWWDVFDR